MYISYALNDIFIGGEISIRSMELILEHKSSMVYRDYQTMTYTALIINVAFESPLYLNGTFPLPLSSGNNANLWGSVRLFCNNGETLFDSHPNINTFPSDNPDFEIPLHLIPLNVDENNLPDAIVSLKAGLGYV